MALRFVAALAIGLAAVASAAADDHRKRDCPNCPAPRSRYDSEEVVKTSRDIDHSRVIETQSVVPVKRRAVETNKLIVHRNETRHVGVVRHKHTVIERQIRYVRPQVTVVNFVKHQYRIVHRPWSSTAPRPVYRLTPDCDGPRRYRSRSCAKTLRVRG